jgi:4-azaleucine resistance transporter AzlC
MNYMEENRPAEHESKYLAALCYAFPKTVPVMAGYLVLGAAYGILMSDNGYGIWWALLISVFVYAGSLQYLGITFFMAFVNPWYAFFMSLMLNARHLFYGISMLDKYKGAGKLKPYLIFSLTDETFSVVCNENPPENISKYLVYFFVSLLDQFYWAAGTLIGAIAGAMIPFDTAGMDFALTALFVVIFVDQWKSGQGHRSALTGVAASVLCLKLFGQSVFIVPAMVVILIMITAGYYMEKKKEEQS